MDEQNKDRSIDRVFAELLADEGLQDDPYKVFANAPGFHLTLLSIWEKAGRVEPHTTEEVKAIEEELFGLLLVAYLTPKEWDNNPDEPFDEEEYGREKARALKRLKALRRLLKPEVYEVPDDLIDKLAAQEMNPHFSRAYELREIMVELSQVLEPRRPDTELSASCEVVIKPKVLTSPATEKSFDWKKTRAFQWASKHCKNNSTLQSIAFKAFRDQLEAEGLSSTASEDEWDNYCKRDLRKLKEWEEGRPKGSGTEQFDQRLKFSRREFSTGWKLQRRDDEG